MGADADEEGQEGDETKADGQLCRITRAGPLCANETILLLAAVAHALGEIATLPIGEDLLPLAIAARRRVRQAHHLTFAAFHEAIADVGTVVEQLASGICEPGSGGS
jgi:hypothetical protein